MVLKIWSYTFTLKIWKKCCEETIMAFLPPLKVRRHTPTILALLLLFTTDLKEGHIIEKHSWIDREVVNFVIQTHHIPSVGVLVIVLVILYIEGGIDKRVDFYGCSTFFTSIKKSGSLSLGTHRSIFSLGVWWVLPYQPSRRSETMNLILRPM